MAQGDIEYSNPNIEVPECVKKLYAIKDQITAAKHKHPVSDDIFSDDFYTQAENAEKEAKKQGYFNGEEFNASRNEYLKTWDTPDFRAELQIINDGIGELTIYKK